MAPTPQELRQGVEGEVLSSDGERTVVSGMSGLYPSAASVKDLSDMLYNKVNPIHDKARWAYHHPEASQYVGLIPGIQRFDAQFFRVHFHMASNMDPMSRKLLEQTYQALYDSGLNPKDLNGKNIGVYIGVSSSESEKASFYVPTTNTGFGIAGCNRAMFANRISYWLNLKGPSLSIDTVCTSSLSVLEQACKDMSSGRCEAAIVGGANITLHPQSSVINGRIVKMSLDGKTKSYSQNADGCVRTESVSVIILQKAKHAKRIYAEIVHVKSRFTELVKIETGPKFGFYREPKVTADFLKQFYKEINFDPKAIEYVEGTGAADPESEKAELEALEEVFCTDREDPLLVGSIISNIGYSEAATGIAGIIKILLGYRTGKMAGNLHCDTPRQDIAAIRSGKMKILTDHEKFHKSFTAVNGLSISGVNAHALLNGYHKPKDLNRYKSKIPHLVTISGRKESAVRKILNDLKSRPVDPEELALFHDIHSTSIPGHLGRGYTILDSNVGEETVVLSEVASYFDNAKPPLWFVYSGMGSQWAGMGTQLMRIPVFAAAIERCRKALEPKGVDILDIITSPDKSMFNNILNSFVGIAAIQIGLTDVLKAIGIEPDMIIGHSVGELGCAYADGCFTAEEMILSAYSRGLVSVQTPFIRGSMAAVGIGYEEVSKLLPPEIEVACHNGPDSSTISGPADKMKEFVTELTNKGIFAKEVPCSNIAYHSRYIAEAGPGLLKYLSEVIKNPKPRSKRWLSTSVPKNKWDDPVAQFSSAEYHTNNLLNPVLFEETIRSVPADAVLIEIAPHGLLQAILKRSLPDTCKNIPLTRRGHPDNAFFVLDAIGKLFMEGYHPKVNALYPKIEYPVSNDTPMLSHLIEWEHGEYWIVPYFVAALRKTSATAIYHISIFDPEYEFLVEYNVKGKNVYPYSAALVAVWDTLAMSLNKPKKELSVEFSDLRFYAQPVLYEQKTLVLIVALQKGTGLFEVMVENRKVASGAVSEKIQEKRSYSYPFKCDDAMDLNSDDIYQMLYERECSYGDTFRVIHSASSAFSQAQIIWNNNWVSLLDGVLQFSALKYAKDNPIEPLQIRRIAIDIDYHIKCQREVDGKIILPADVVNEEQTVRCGGILVDNIIFKNVVPSKEEFLLKTVKFVPRFQSNVNAESLMQIFLQILAENINKDTINVVELVNYKNEAAFSNQIKNIIKSMTNTVNYEVMTREHFVSNRDYILYEVDLVIVQDLLLDDGLCQILYRTLPRDLFLVNFERIIDDRVRPSTLYKVISGATTGSGKLELLKWRPTQITAASTVVTVRLPSDLSLLKSTRETLPQRHKLVILSPYPPLPGLKEVVKEWRKESDRNQIYMVMISEKDYLDELPELDLVFNVLNEGVWGGEYEISVQETVPIDRLFALRCPRVGMDALKWVEVPESSEPGIAVNVHYAAINDIDVKRATGLVKFTNINETAFGMDFSGVTDSGQRVMGIVPCGSLSKRVKAQPELMWPVPEHWSLEDAATVPSAYFMAFYCLVIKTQLLGNYKVLIHGGAGALGQAAISIALATGAEVFTTVSNMKKKKFLFKLFPELKEDHIGNSRDNTFGDMVNMLTKSTGCNIVISCVRGEQKNVTLNVTAMSGVTIDLVQLPTQEEYNFGLFSLTKERNYYTVDIMSVFKKENVHQWKQIQEMMCQGIEAGYVRPLSRVVLPPNDVSRGFRLLASSQQRGRVLVNFDQDNVFALPRLCCSPDLCQVIISKGDAFGSLVVERLIDCGAKNLVLHSDNYSTSFKLKIKSWQNQGIKVRISSNDLRTSNGVTSLLKNDVGVEGIHVLATGLNERTADVLKTVVANLDVASRKICPNLKFFSVINDGVKLGHNICLSRVKDGLPAKILTLPRIYDVKSTIKHIIPAAAWRSAVDAIERAICSSDYALTAHRASTTQPPLLEQIARVAGFKIPENVSDSSTLSDLGMEQEKVAAVNAFLIDEHNLALAIIDDNILNLTVRQVKDLEEGIKGNAFKERKGLGKYFTHVDTDEIMGTTEVVRMPTLVTSSNMRDDEFDVNLTHLCVVPGMEGHHLRFATLCTRLKLPALVLQPGLDCLDETFSETAERFAKFLLKRIKVRDNFYLVGYETGVFVTLEVAAILEEHGYKGTIYLIGGTPEEIKASIEKDISRYETDEELKEAVIKHIFGLMGGNPDCLDEELNKYSTFEEKIEACVRLLLGQVPHSAQYTRTLFKKAFNLLKQTSKYVVEPKALKSRIIVLHASDLDDNIESTVQRYSQQPVVVHNLPTPLGSITNDLRCSAIVNAYLDPEFLDAYSKKNICETYRSNADEFMTLANANYVPYD